MPHNILVTGSPGVGKTTLIVDLVEWAAQQEKLTVKGFYTSEIREQGRRKGFEIHTTEDEHDILAHVDIDSPHRVSKYKVDVERFESIIEPLFSDSSSGNVLYVIDEIGKMECFSKSFTGIVEDLVDSKNPLIATIAQKGGGFIKEVKKRPDCEIITLNRDTFGKVAQNITSRIQEFT